MAQTTVVVTRLQSLDFLTVSQIKRLIRELPGSDGKARHEKASAIQKLNDVASWLNKALGEEDA